MMITTSMTYNHHNLSIQIVSYDIWSIDHLSIQIMSGVACIFCGLLQGQTDPDLKNLQVGRLKLEFDHHWLKAKQWIWRHTTWSLIRQISIKSSQLSKSKIWGVPLSAWQYIPHYHWSDNYQSNQLSNLATQIELALIRQISIKSNRLSNYHI